MAIQDELAKLQQKMEQDQGLKDRFEAELRRIAEREPSLGESGAIMKAAEAVGSPLLPTAQGELDDDALDSVAGGVDIGLSAMDPTMFMEWGWLRNLITSIFSGSMTNTPKTGEKMEAPTPSVKNTLL